MIIHDDIEDAWDKLEATVKLLGELSRQKDAAYAERNRLVAALAAMFPSSIEMHPVEDKFWEDDWRNIVFIDLPTGQVSWHIHDSELPLFGHVPYHKGRKWDGHTNEEKYARLDSFAKSHAP